MNVSRETLKALEQYQLLTLKWNKSVNLISSHTENDFWNRHIYDSLQLMRYIKCEDIHLVDAGSGAGFPGIVLSIAGIKNVTLIESDVKKSIFLHHASKVSNNKIDIINQRLENVALNCDVFTSRAFAPLQKILHYGKNITVSNKYLLLKGADYQKEISDAQKEWSFCYVAHDSLTSKSGKILEISNVRKLHDKNNSHS